MVRSLTAALASSSVERALLRVDVLTPGLNPRLEQKAMLSQDILFDLITAVFPIVTQKYQRIKVLFPSVGDAGGFLKHCSQQLARGENKYETTKQL